jgi:flavin-dependent dehydrogenase
MTETRTDVAIVGGGPAGALTAMLLARAGRDVVLFERAPRWKWRACGVFASPASVAALRRLGIEPRQLATVAQPVPAMDVVSARGTHFRMTYGGTGVLADSAVGFDRSALDPMLLELARSAGADVRPGVAVERVDLASAHARLGVTATEPERERGEIVARVVVAADGLRSRVASAARVTRRAPLGPRAALTFHIDDPRRDAASGSRDARMCVIEHGYVGLAPVPGGRLNVGIVLERPWFARLRASGGREVARQALERLPDPADRELARAEPIDHVAGVTPLAHAVRHRAGGSWLLVGDAAGFLDPFTGEGLHRAFVSAELAAEVIDAARNRLGRGLDRYEQAMRGRFATKDLVSRVVQAFLARPRLFEYAARRLGTRSGVRETMGLVIGDLAPASEVLDPRYLAGLLRP